MIVAIVVANAVMFLTMYLAIRWFAMVIAVPKHILFPFILMMCVIGAYTINYGIIFDVWTLLIFGLLGWLAGKLRLAVVLCGLIVASLAASVLLARRSALQDADDAEHLKL